MAFSDRFRKVMGIPALPSEAEVRLLPFQRALAQKDVDACLQLAFGYLRAQQHADAVRAFELLAQQVPERKAEWLRWQGHTYVPYHPLAVGARETFPQVDLLKLLGDEEPVGHRSADFRTEHTIRIDAATGR